MGGGASLFHDQRDGPQTDFFFRNGLFFSNGCRFMESRVCFFGRVRGRGLAYSRPPRSPPSIFACGEHERRLSFCRVFSRFCLSSVPRFYREFVLIVGRGSFIHSPHLSSVFFSLFISFRFRCAVVLMNVCSQPVLFSSILSTHVVDRWIR